MESPLIENKPTLRDVWGARKRISSIIKKTPLMYSFILSERTGRPVYLKLENIHDTGAFKVRGAANKILSLSENEKRNGVTTFSTGNHGMAVAYVAKKLGIKAIVCISNRVPAAKVDVLKRLGATLEIYGESQDEAAERCLDLQKQRGLTVIPPFDDREIIAGQGTIGLEIIEDIPDLTDVVIPLSGGGLFSGIGLALKSMDPSIRVTGVSMEHSAVMHESLKTGKPIKMTEQATLADSLLGGIGLNNHYTFSMVKEYNNGIHLIPEKEIAKSMAFMMEHHRLMIEGAAATGIAAILGKKITHQEGSIVSIISGSNVDLAVLKQVFQNERI